MADRKEGIRPENARPFESLMPLEEVIGAAMGKSPSSKVVQQRYKDMIRTLGPEFDILRIVPL